MALVRPDGGTGCNVAEFDLIVKDSSDRLAIVEVKDRLNPGRKIERQFRRHLGFMKKSPFQSAAVKRVIVVSKPTDGAFLAPWEALGLEFISLPNDVFK